MVGEPSFLELSGAEVAGVVESDDVEAKEEEVLAAVMGWVKAEEAGRKAELDRLLPRVRFPLMQEPATAMMAEPLVRQHALFWRVAARDPPGVRQVRRGSQLPAADATEGDQATA
jgi:hypothetical protein